MPLRKDRYLAILQVLGARAEAGRRVTVGDAIELLGIRDKCDTALPQSWAYDVQDVTGVYPVGQMVWYYGPGFCSFGRPFPICTEGIATLEKYERALAARQHRPVAPTFGFLED